MLPGNSGAVLASRCKEEDIELIHFDRDTPITTEELRSSLITENTAETTGLLCLLTDRVDKDLIEEAAQAGLATISTYSVGVDHIDVGAAAGANVSVGYTPGVLTQSTANLALGLTLATALRIPEAAACVKDGSWDAWHPTWMAGKELTDATFGIVGGGRIGAAYGAKVAAAFDGDVLYTSRSGVKPEMDLIPGARRVCLDELLATSDVVSLHCDLNPSTERMFDAQAFAAMKNDAILINTARGPMVDQDDLYAALTAPRDDPGAIGAAGLDVMVPEPLPTDSPLLQCPNCVITPHIASATHHTRQRMAVMAIDNLFAGLDRAPLPFPYPL